MDIGTGKPSLQERTLVPHHMFDVVEPYEAFNVVAYQSMALNIIEEILKRGNLPIIVGGTGLYISALFYDVKFEAAPGDEFIRIMSEKIYSIILIYSKNVLKSSLPIIEFKKSFKFLFKIYLIS